MKMSIMLIILIPVNMAAMAMKKLTINLLATLYIIMMVHQRIIIVNGTKNVLKMKNVRIINLIKNTLTKEADVIMGFVSFR